MHTIRRYPPYPTTHLPTYPPTLPTYQPTYLPYLQVPRILGPVARVVEQLKQLFENPALKSYAEEVSGEKRKGSGGYRTESVAAYECCGWVYVPHTDTDSECEWT